MHLKTNFSLCFTVGFWTAAVMECLGEVYLGNLHCFKFCTLGSKLLARPLDTVQHWDRIQPSLKNHK